MEQTTNGNTLELAGSLDVRCTAELRAAVYRLLEQHDGDVLVDISPGRVGRPDHPEDAGRGQPVAERQGRQRGAARRLARRTPAAAPLPPALDAPRRAGAATPTAV